MAAYTYSRWVGTHGRIRYTVVHPRNLVPRTHYHQSGRVPYSSVSQHLHSSRHFHGVGADPVPDLASRHVTDGKGGPQGGQEGCGQALGRERDACVAELVDTIHAISEGQQTIRVDLKGNTLILAKLKFPLNLVPAKIYFFISLWVFYGYSKLLFKKIFPSTNR